MVELIKQWVADSMLGVAGIPLLGSAMGELWGEILKKHAFVEEKGQELSF